MRHFHSPKLLHNLLQTSNPPSSVIFLFGALSQFILAIKVMWFKFWIYLLVKPLVKVKHTFGFRKRQIKYHIFSRIHLYWRTIQHNSRWSFYRTHSFMIRNPNCIMTQHSRLWHFSQRIDADFVARCDVIVLGSVWSRNMFPWMELPRKSQIRFWFTVQD